MGASSQRTARAWFWVRLRRRHRLTQADLAERLGVSRTTIWNVERAEKHRPRKQMLEKFHQLQQQLERERPELPWED